MSLEFQKSDGTARPTGSAILVSLAGLLLGIFAFALRAYRLDRSWDIFIDEVSYLRLSENVADHLEVSLYGDHFYLHPPAFFFLEALYLLLFDQPAHVIDQVQSVRYVNVVLAGISAAVIFYIGYRVAGALSGLLASFLFALDPFIVRINSRNLLETSAIMWVLIGFAILFSCPDLKGRQVPVRYGIAAGIAFGLGLLTKDMIFFLTLAPLGACFILNWSLSRRLALLTAGVTAITYLPYLILVAAVGDTSRFFDQKFQGARRLAGTVQETGFNQEEGPSFVEAILAQLDTFATTYVILGIGIIAMAALILKGNERYRLVGLWSGCAYGLLAYSLAFGTLEEQFFYFLVIPSIVSIAVAAPFLWRSYAHRYRYRRVALSIAILLILTFSSWSGYIWWRIHTVPDNGYEHVIEYLNQNVPDGAHIAVTTEVAQFILEGYVTGVWVSVDEFRANDAEYVLVSTGQIEKGYLFADEDILEWLRANAQLVYSFQGRSFGSLEVYRLPEDISQYEGRAVCHGQDRLTVAHASLLVAVACDELLVVR